MATQPLGTQRAAALGRQVGSLLRTPPSSGNGAPLERSAYPQQVLRAGFEQAATDSRFSPAEQNLLGEELRFQQLFRFEDLPRAGVCLTLRPACRHAGESGVGWLASTPRPSLPRWYSVAAVALDVLWGEQQEDGSEPPPDFEAYAAFLSGIHSETPLTAIERGASPTLLRLACALRALGRNPCGENEPGNHADATEGEALSPWAARLMALRSHATTLPRYWPGTV